MADAAERQGRADRLQAIMSGMIPSASFDPSTMITGVRDMPGATPRQPAYREKFGGQEFVMPELPGVKAERERIEGVQRVKASDVVKRTALVNAWQATGATPEQAMAYANAGVAVPANRLAAPVKKLKPWQEQGFDSEREFRAYESRNPKPASASSQPTQEELDEAEAAWNSELKQQLIPAFDALRARGDRRPPQVLMLAAYRALKARAALPVEAGGMRKPAENAVVGYLSGGGVGVNPAAAGIPGGAPAAAPPAARVAPVVPPKPASAPATSSDAAYKQSQRGALWESIKASNPTLSDDEITAQVMRRIP